MNDNDLETVHGILCLGLNHFEIYTQYSYCFFKKFAQINHIFFDTFFFPFEIVLSYPAMH